MAELTGEDAPGKPRRSSVATLSLLLLIALVFLLELMVSIAAYRPSLGRRPPPWELQVDLLVTLGANSWRLVFGDGEWWRMLTAPILHAGPVHVLLNGLALWIVGPRLERLVGAAWLLAVFVASCIFGDLVSMLFNSPEMAGVGASGGLMGLAAAALVVSVRVSSGSSRRAALIGSGLMAGLIPTMIFPMASGATVDHSAHLGGALCGLALGLFLLCRRTEPVGLRPESPFAQVRRGATGGSR
jgi:rhomboid protease GluP